MTQSAPMRFALILIAVLVASAGAYADPPPVAAAAPATRPAQTVRVAVIGGVNDGGFWRAVAERFEQKTGIHIEAVANGNKDGVADLFKRGGIDFITVQSPETIVSLVVAGYARDAQPWVQTELVIVGPAADPAGIKGMADAAAAVKKVIASKAPFVVHASLGADQVVRAIVQADKGELSDGRAIMLLGDHQKRVLQVAADKQAYTLIAGGPFREGKIPAGGLVELVHGDPILRRPFLLAVADPRKVADARPSEAKRLAEFLRSDETQRWIDGWRAGQAADVQVFFPVAADAAATLPRH